VNGLPRERLLDHLHELDSISRGGESDAPTKEVS
jgi:hypothetical protein